MNHNRGFENFIRGIRGEDMPNQQPPTSDVPNPPELTLKDFERIEKKCEIQVGDVVRFRGLKEAPEMKVMGVSYSLGVYTCDYVTYKGNRFRAYYDLAWFDKQSRLIEVQVSAGMLEIITLARVTDD